MYDSSGIDYLSIKFPHTVRVGRYTWEPSETRMLNFKKTILLGLVVLKRELTHLVYKYIFKTKKNITVSHSSMSHL